ncbi:HAD-IA family hydrolase [uncultured Microbacterium sp.]|uniref:HAD-IA family hydrolase n=1 Tax=uncultured Microbacterium sp. TaxID=191216 RepID=UPI002619A3DC|nr:HAD-IA family hydrolase [uncultured Microbacterium sp.]
MTTITARAALLDMDGTLVDSTAIVERLWWEWAEPHGLDWRTVLETVHGRQGWQSMAMLLPDRDHGINIVENEQMLDRESIETDGVVEIAGAARFLQSLAPFPHAVVTSANLALMTARMGAAGLTIPALAITAERVANSKPHPEGFLLAASILDVAPADCVVFEDSGAGIQAGLDAGMTVIGVGPHAPKFSPTHHVDDLTGMRIDADAAGFTISFG